MMKNYYWWWWMVAAFVLALVGGGVWLNKDEGKSPDAQGKLVVGASIWPVADMVRRVGGEMVAVKLLIPSGSSPHSYTLLPSQVAELQAARVIFSIGQGLDDNVVEAVNGSVGADIVTLDKGIELHLFNDGFDGINEKFGDIDPHYWLDVENAQVMVGTIAEKLSRIDAEHADEYVAKAAEYEQELQRLERGLQQQVSNLDQKSILTMHDGWEYFARAYGLQVAATYEPVEGKQPTVEDLSNILTVINKFGLKRFYTEPQKASTAATRFMQEEFGLEIGILDPIGGSEGVDSYEELMRKNIEAVTR